MKDFTLDDISKVQPRERFENLRQLRKNRGNPTRNDKLQKYVDTNECQKTMRWYKEVIMSGTITHSVLMSLPNAQYVRTMIEGNEKLKEFENATKRRLEQIQESSVDEIKELKQTVIGLEAKMDELIMVNPEKNERDEKEVGEIDEPETVEQSGRIKR